MLQKKYGYSQQFVLFAALNFHFLFTPWALNIQFEPGPQGIRVLGQLEPSRGVGCINRFDHLLEIGPGFFAVAKTSFSLENFFGTFSGIFISFFFSSLFLIRSLNKSKKWKVSSIEKNCVTICMMAQKGDVLKTLATIVKDVNLLSPIL